MFKTLLARPLVTSLKNPSRLDKKALPWYTDFMTDAPKGVHHENSPPV